MRITNLNFTTSSNVESENLEDLPILPDEIWLMIFGFALPEDILNLSLVGRKFNQLSSDHSLWKMICQSHPDFIERGQPDYKRAYFQFASVRSNYKENRFLIRKDFFPPHLPHGVLSCDEICFEIEGGIIEIYDLNNGQFKRHLERIEPNASTHLPNPLRDFTTSSAYFACGFETNSCGVYEKESNNEIYAMENIVAPNVIFFLGQKLFIFFPNLRKLIENDLSSRSDKYITFDNIIDCSQFDSENLLYLNGDSYLLLYNIKTQTEHHFYVFPFRVLAIALEPLSKKCLAFIHEDTGYKLTVYDGISLSVQGIHYTSNQTIPLTTLGKLMWHQGYLWLIEPDGDLYKIDLTERTISKFLTKSYYQTIHFYQERVFVINREGKCDVLEFAATSQEIYQDISKDEEPEMALLRAQSLPIEKQNKIKGDIHGLSVKRRRHE